MKKRIPLRRLFRFHLIFPRISSAFRSLSFHILLPGLFIDYMECSPSIECGMTVSGCAIGVFNPLQLVHLWDAIPCWYLVRDERVICHHEDLGWSGLGKVLSQ